MTTASFVADVGGTNIRLALVKDSAICSIKKYLCDDFESIDAAIEQFRVDCNLSGFKNACIAIAGPVTGEQIAMTNHSWSFSKKSLSKRIGTEHLFVINDFTAVAFSLPELSQEQLIQIGDGTPVTKGNIAVFGPGTGLGVEHLTWTSNGWLALDGEGGHVDFAPNDENDIHIWRYLKEKFGRASTEEVLSGRGLVHIYTALALASGTDPKYTEPSEVTESALTGNDQLCKAAVQQFGKIMGSFAGDLALNLCTTGGVFIGGGVTSKLGDMFINSEFRECFEAKGAMAGYVKSIPTFLIDEPDHGLIGAKAYLIQHIEQTQ